MLPPGSTSRIGAAFVAATAITGITAGVALAHPESEGDHAGPEPRVAGSGER